MTEQTPEIQTAIKEGLLILRHNKIEKIDKIKINPQEFHNLGLKNKYKGIDVELDTDVESFKIAVKLDEQKFFSHTLYSPERLVNKNESAKYANKIIKYI